MGFSRFEWNMGGSGPVGAYPSSSGMVFDDLCDIPLVRVRRGGSSNEVMLALEQVGKCKVTGPPGCGKSSKFVEAIAIESRRPVVHLVPHPRLVGEFVKRGYGSVSSTDDLSALFGITCTVRCPIVIVTTYTALLSRSLVEHRPITELTRRPIYYCDECHESDAATFSLVRHFKCRRDGHNAIFVSATLDGENYAAIEPTDPIVDDFLPRSMDTSEFCDAVVSAIKRNMDCTSVLLYNDLGLFGLSALEKAIRDVGFEWYSVDSRTSQDDFDVAMTALRSSSKVVLRVDSSYRSGFDFPVSMVIDSTLVSCRRSSNPNEYKMRLAFGFELYQARGRLGRCSLGDSQRLVYCRVDASVPRKLAVIEGYEAVLAAQIIHAQGHRLPSCFDGLNIGERSGFLRDYRLLDSDVMITANLMEVSRMQLKADFYRACSPSFNSTSSGSEYGDPLASLSRLNLNKPRPAPVPSKVGIMINVAGSVEPTISATVTFPRGGESVRQALLNQGLTAVLPVLSRHDVLLVSSTLVSDMNNLSCEFLAADALVKYVTKEETSRRSTLQEKWLRDFHSDLGLKASRYAAKSRELQQLIDNSGLDFAEISAREFRDVISQIAASYISIYKSQMNHWRSPDAIVGLSRDKYISGISLNTGYDSRGQALIDNAIGDTSKPKDQEPVKSNPFKEKSGSDNKPRKRMQLNSSHPSVETMRTLYPNTEFTMTPQRNCYERRRSVSSSGRSGSWLQGISNKDDNKFLSTTAKTWKAPPD